MQHRTCFLALLVLTSLLSAAPGWGAAQTASVLAPVDSLEDPQLDESSGLVRSLRLPGVFWTHNDSGDEARLFAVDSSGATLKPAWAEDYRGLRLLEAANHDWEDLAQDGEGNLIVADLGNNGSARRDLAVYVLPEPDPRAVEAVRAVTRILVAYPDQCEFPPKERNFDCEAVFFARGALHVLTKHRSDTHTRLYRLDAPAGQPPRTDRPWHEAFRPDRVHALTFLGEADVAGLSSEVAGLVTAADADLDGRRLVILSYTGLFLVENDPGGPALRTGNLLAGRWRWLPIAAEQCEAVALDGGRVWITNEQRGLFRVELDQLQAR
ncbi:MAG: hypothetical protein WC326_15815 [Candidatus Delongbacteria bacterium]